MLSCAQQVTSASQLNKVIFKDRADAAITRKFTSLFPGLGYAAGYKVRPHQNCATACKGHYTDGLQRYYKESINMGGNPSSAITLLFIMGTNLIARLEKAPGKP